ncbi:hypothetical protein IBX73_00960 [candidate division WOR-3 bacterium]|nr:hypothetical protein [candidate division WOR-3 bacterium]
MKGLLIFIAFSSAAFATNYHGCALAPDGLNGWVVSLDTALILHTTDGGVTWTPQQVPPDTIGRKLWDVTCYDGMKAWTTGLHELHTAEILHTADGGSHWHRQYAGFSKYGTRIEFSNEYYGLSVGGNGALARTTDGGNYWEQVFTDWFQAEYYGVSIVNQWDSWICAGWPDSIETGQGYIVRTYDGGITWDTLNGYRAPGYEDFFDIHMFNVFEGIVVGGYDGTYEPIIWKTTDGGATWNPITPPAGAYYLRAVDFVEQEGWAVGKSGTIIHTTNAGNTWTIQTSPADSTLFDVDFRNHLHGLACGYNYILLTTDGGQNWQHVGVEEHDTGVPTGIALTASPNPFSKLTNVNFSIEHGAERIELRIYDATGRLVKDLHHAMLHAPCAMQVLWDGTDERGRFVPQGVYFIRLQAPDIVRTIKTILLR